MTKIGIVVIGYNREDSIQRLLDRLNKCFYGNNKNIPLVISLDNCGSDEVQKCAESFEWKFGKKIIRTYPKRLGLKNHILKCGDFINEFNWDASIVFEDDVYPSVGFYNFASQAVEYYAHDERIAGISLYSHQWNIHKDLPFQAFSSGKSDVYFLQMAQSWGQVWMKKQWNSFSEWYQTHEEFTPSNDVPNTYSNWPKSSWLKYHNQYCIENKKYFVYPYQGLSTCFSDAGEHAAFSSSVFQIGIEECADKKYSFDDLEKGMVYDAFFESMNVKKMLEELVQDTVTVDLYGQKTKFDSRYILTTNSLPYNIVQSYGLDLRPIECNVYNTIKGNAIKLYDTSQKVTMVKENTRLMLWLYMQKQIPDWGTIIDLIKFKLHYKLALTKKKFQFKK